MERYLSVCLQVLGAIQDSDLLQDPFPGASVPSCALLPQVMCVPEASCPVQTHAISCASTNISFFLSSLLIRSARVRLVYLQGTEHVVGFTW